MADDRWSWFGRLKPGTPRQPVDADRPSAIAHWASRHHSVPTLPTPWRWAALWVGATAVVAFIGLVVALVLGAGIAPVQRPASRDVVIPGGAAPTDSVAPPALPRPTSTMPAGRETAAELNSRVRDLPSGATPPAASSTSRPATPTAAGPLPGPGASAAVQPRLTRTSAHPSPTPLPGTSPPPTVLPPTPSGSPIDPPTSPPAQPAASPSPG